MLRYLACLIGFFAIISVLPAHGQAAGNSGTTSNLSVGLAGGIIGGIPAEMLSIDYSAEYLGRQ